MPLDWAMAPIQAMFIRDPVHGYDEGYRFGTVDCTGLINQLLLRLGRGYGIIDDGHDWGCEYGQDLPQFQPTDWDNLQPGDLIIWTIGGPCHMHHAAIFERWTRPFDHKYATVWEAVACQDDHHDAHPDIQRKPAGVNEFNDIQYSKEFKFQRFTHGHGNFFDDCQ